MWMYERKLMYPVKIKKPNPRLAQIVISQYGGAYCKCLSKKTTAIYSEKSSNYGARSIFRAFCLADKMCFLALIINSIVHC